MFARLGMFFQSIGSSQPLRIRCAAVVSVSTTMSRPMGCLAEPLLDGAGELIVVVDVLEVLDPAAEAPLELPQQLLVM